MIILLPFPDMKLSPNRKHGNHWGKTQTAKKSAFDTAYYATKDAMAKQQVARHATTLEISFIEPDKRRRDIDNLLSASKASIDGMCKALNIDDHQFDVIKLKRGYQKGDGKLLIRLCD